jgi:hypothetical protein
MQFLHQPWPWYITGPLLGLSVPLLLLLGNKPLGASASFRHFCSIFVPKKGLKYFRYDWKKETWHFYFVLGIALGGFLAGFVIPNKGVHLNPKLIAELGTYGVYDLSKQVPVQLFNFKSISQPEGITFIIFGGFLLGFGARYAAGDNSAHTILGLSSLNRPSMVATLFFFIGGIACAYFIIPFILKVN